MASNLYTAISALGQSAVAAMTAKEIGEAVKPVASNAGMISRELAKLGWTSKSARGDGKVNTVKADTDYHFNGYSNNLSDAFRRAYHSYRDVNADAPEIADIYSQVTSECKTYIASISENVLFNAMLKASNCKEPSRDFELLGIKTSSMIAAEKQAAEKQAADNAALVAKLESSGYLVFKTFEAPCFNAADIAISHKASFEEKLVAFKALLADKVKMDKALADCINKLDKATVQASKEALSAKVDELTDAVEKAVADIANAGKALVALASIIKGNADKATKRNDAIISLVDGLVDASAKRTQEAIEAAQAAHDAVNSIVTTVQEQAPKAISLEEQRAINLVKQGFCTDIDKARAMVKAMDSGLSS